MHLISTIRQKASEWVAHGQYAWLGWPDHILHFGYGIGDDLLMTIVARELKRRGAGRIAILAKHGSLYAHNPDVATSRPWGLREALRLRRWGHHVCIPFYGGYDPDQDRDLYGQQHIIVSMCQAAGITGRIELRPILNLLPEEERRGRHFERQIVMHTGGTGLLRNKEWLPERTQAVADQLSATARIIQLGQPSDPPIGGAFDLRGKTTLRETAAILRNSLLLVGQVGFLMHLARAMDTRSVIIFGGRELPEITGYAANENLVGRTPCSPCWQRTRCDFDHACMRLITVEEVVAAAELQIDRFASPLPVETFDVSSPTSSPSSHSTI